MVTLGVALLLAAGLLVAKICQRLYMPSVTGYILAGMLLGPSGFDLINRQSIGSNLDHFTHIALMLISFGIGEHVELKKLREHVRSVAWIGGCEALCAFVFVSVAVFVTVHFTGMDLDGWQLRDHLAISLLLGAVGLATAPAATLLVIREVKASGSFTATLLAIVAIDNGLAIMIFGFAISIAHHIMGQLGDPFYLVIFKGFVDIGQSLLLGMFTGMLLDLVLRKLKSQGEMMTGGLALLLLCSELARYLELSSLLAGMAAGVILVNRAERDVRMFRALNSFEPPIYVLFFTLAGTHLDIKALGAAGILGTIYFLARIAGKINGVALGARIAAAPQAVLRYLGFGLLPQAGVAIGLIFLISSDPILSEYASIITPVVLTGVLLSELIGPLAVRFAVDKAGEAHGLNEEKSREENGLSPLKNDLRLRSAEGVEILPWTWEKLSPQIPSQGVVVFGAAHYIIVSGLARFATIFANYYRCLPMAVRVVQPEAVVPARLFQKELEEVASMGYPLATELVPDSSVASGLVAGVEYNAAKMVVLGYPLHGTVSSFHEVLETVAGHVSCPVVVVRFFGVLHTERILIPVVSLEDLEDVYPVMMALDLIGEHQMKLIYLLHSGEADSLLKAKEAEVNQWLSEREQKVDLSVKVVVTDSRVEAILEESEGYDLVVMGATRTQVIKKFFFGSLADTVSKRLQKTMLIVYMPDKV
ncbi:MAG: cation:proton antiporter [Proteobacteria bacterium]|nr:cation:proton antiporter [Pseudomonadota bacterium]MBU1058587.1 cation:proton antiporter [Pseudomonadota bacterium]